MGEKAERNVKCNLEDNGYFKGTMKKALFIILLFGAYISQAQSDLDSLYRVWTNQSATDTNRAIAFHQYIYQGYAFSKPDSGLVLARELYDFSERIDFHKGRAMALKLEGFSYSVKGDYRMTLAKFKASLRIFEELNDRKNIAASLNNIGIIFQEPG